MSKEVIEAVFRYSHIHKKQLMLICSRNQIDVDSGYVFTTNQYINYIYLMKNQYPLSNVVICRDHCGPGFGSPSDSLESVKETIDCDLEQGFELGQIFDIIHIDLCHAIKNWNMNALDFKRAMSHKERIQNTVELMEFARNLNPNIMFEIGTDENVGRVETDIDKIVSDVRACQEVANPVFYVVQTGSLVREISNVGSFDVNKVRTIHEALQKCGVKLKEHNADYLTSEQISARRNVVDAVNIAPQLGVVQTSHVLHQALKYGVDVRPFMDEVIHGQKWQKWVRHITRLGNTQLCCLIAGHYHFNGQAYEQLIEKLKEKIDIKESIMDEITKVIEHYMSSLE